MNIFLEHLLYSLHEVDHWGVFSSNLLNLKWFIRGPAWTKQAAVSGLLYNCTKYISELMFLDKCKLKLMTKKVEKYILQIKKCYLFYPEPNPESAGVWIHRLSDCVQKTPCHNPMLFQSFISLLR